MNRCGLGAEEGVYSEERRACRTVLSSACLEVDVKVDVDYLLVFVPGVGGLGYNKNLEFV